MYFRTLLCALSDSDDETVALVFFSKMVVKKNELTSAKLFSKYIQHVVNNLCNGCFSHTRKENIYKYK